MERPECGVQYAEKQIQVPNDAQAWQLAQAEVSMLVECRHPHIIDCISAWQQGSVVHILMECAHHGDLASLLACAPDIPMHLIPLSHDFSPRWWFQ